MSTSGPYGTDWLRTKLNDETAVQRAIEVERIRLEALRQKRSKKFVRLSNIVGFPGMLFWIVGGLTLFASLFVMLFAVALDSTETVLWTPRTMAAGALFFLTGMGLMKLATYFEKEAKK